MSGEAPARSRLIGAEEARPEQGSGGCWRPSLGAWPGEHGTRFRVWAPEQADVAVVISGEPARLVPLERYADGTWGGYVENVFPGARYRYRLPCGDFPDPASRYQPEGVHEASQVVDPGDFSWTDWSWRGIDRDALLIYELHVGAFSPEGTFDGVRARLDYLQGLGVNAIELMPVADFPGGRNWGYDGVCPFAPARCYGPPEALRRLIDAAHGAGMAVILDVVYNHLGPEGNYLPTFSPYYFHEDRESPWGRALNFDGPRSEMVRRYFIENALHWIHEYHFDGLRLDATHAILDESDIPFVSELTTRVHASVGGRCVAVIAEDHRNRGLMVRPEGAGGWGLDGVWADDFHHAARVCLTGDRDGYYQDYDGTTAQLVRTLNNGWLYTGQYSRHLETNRGTDTQGINSRRFVCCIQNHDQIGNRALGERLNHQISPAAYRAASTLLLCSPGTPLLFMGQEWATAAPFLYFTDHPRSLGRMVTEGRRREFQGFAMFADESSREAIPDPQSSETFARSGLDWSETAGPPHSSVLELYRALLALRRSEAALREARSGAFTAWALSGQALLLRHEARSGDALLILVQLDGAGDVDLEGHASLAGLDGSRCRLLLTTEDPPFAIDPVPPAVDLSGAAPRIRFSRPAAVLLHVTRRPADGSGMHG